MYSITNREQFMSPGIDAVALRDKSEEVFLSGKRYFFFAQISRHVNHVMGSLLKKFSLVYFRSSFLS